MRYPSWGYWIRWRLILLLFASILGSGALVLSIAIPLEEASGICDTASEFYDDSVLECNRCVGAIGGSATTNAYLEPDEANHNRIGLPASCTCSSAAYSSYQSDTRCASIWPAPCSLSDCLACPSQHVPARNPTRCMPCGNSTLGINSGINDCTCPANSILIENDIDGSPLNQKECIACSNNTRVDSTTNTCASCPDIEMIIHTASSGETLCKCRDGFQFITSSIFGHGKCVAQTRLAVLGTKVNLNAAALVKFSAFQIAEVGNAGTTISFESGLVQDMFTLAASECYFYQSAKQNPYCQALGNLCVLQHFSPNAPACVLFNLIQKSGRGTTAHNINGWYYTLPFLRYRSNAQTILSSTDISMMMSFDEASDADTSDHLGFILATYSINGTLKGFRRLTNDLLYCVDASTVRTPMASPLWMRFGVSTTSEFSCDLSAFHTSTMDLYELFLIDSSRAEADSSRYIPIPIQNLNYQDELGLFRNRNIQPSDMADDVLSHRFFLFDAVSGVRTGETSPQVLRYVDTITLTVNTQLYAVNKLYRPLLSLSYVDTQTKGPISVRFQVVYSSDTGNFWSSATTLFVIACIIGSIRVLLHIFTWQRRNTRNAEMALSAWASITSVLVTLLSNFARVFFVVVFVLSLYFLFFFKLQSNVFVLLPEMNPQLVLNDMDEYYPFRVVLSLAFVFQLITMLRCIAYQTHVDLFFIDWESPRASVVDPDTNQAQPVPVSVWRTILVANEWNELQIARKTSFGFTLVATVFLLYGCDLRSLAVPIPQAQMSYVTSKSTPASTLATDLELGLNLYLRFANVAVIWLALALGQRLWRWLIYERFFCEPREQLFIDLCTIAKVSCFMLDEAYHGFYLHCRSPYPFADGSMSEITSHLKQEAAGLTVGRGLERTLPEHQTFEVFLTRKWKRKYQTMLDDIHGTSVANDKSEVNSNSSPKRPARTRTLREPHRPYGGRAMSLWQQESGRIGNLASWHLSAAPTTQRMVHHAAQHIMFLKGFIENQDDQFRWRIYRMETCFSRFFRIPPNVSASRQSYFLPDSNSHFCQTIFLGVENDLMLMNILCFTACDLWFNNHAVSAVITYFLEQFLLSLRSHFGNQNVARNTLVDPRFLI